MSNLRDYSNLCSWAPTYLGQDVVLNILYIIQVQVLHIPLQCLGRKIYYKIIPNLEGSKRSRLRCHFDCIVSVYFTWLLIEYRLTFLKDSKAYIWFDQEKTFYSNNRVYAMNWTDNSSRVNKINIIPRDWNEYTSFICLKRCVVLSI